MTPLCECGRSREALAANGEPDCACGHAAARRRFEALSMAYSVSMQAWEDCSRDLVDHRQKRDGVAQVLSDTTAGFELEAHPQSSNDMGRRAIVRTLQSGSRVWQRVHEDLDALSRSAGLSEARVEALRYRMRLLELSMRWEIACREEGRA